MLLKINNHPGFYHWIDESFFYNFIILFVIIIIYDLITYMIINFLITKKMNKTKIVKFERKSSCAKIDSSFH